MYLKRAFDSFRCYHKQNATKQKLATKTANKCSRTATQSSWVVWLCFTGLYDVSFPLVGVIWRR